MELIWAPFLLCIYTFRQIIPFPLNSNARRLMCVRPTVFEWKQFFFEQKKNKRIANWGLASSDLINNGGKEELEGKGFTIALLWRSRKWLLLEIIVNGESRSVVRKSILFESSLLNCCLSCSHSMTWDCTHVVGRRGRARCGKRIINTFRLNSSSCSSSRPLKLGTGQSTLPDLCESSGKWVYSNSLHYCPAYITP